MGPIEPNIFWLYYAGGTVVVLLLLFWKRPRKGMRLRLKGSSRTHYKELGFNGKLTPDLILRRSGAAGTSASGERSINVVFNYNGHSWDAYEVLGIPAGSSFAVVETAYQEGMKQVGGTSKGILEAAFKAIQASAKSA